MSVLTHQTCTGTLMVNTSHQCSSDIACILGFSTWHLPVVAIFEPLFTYWDCYPPLSIFEYLTQSEPVCEIHWDPCSGLNQIFFISWVRDSIFEPDSMLNSVRETGPCAGIDWRSHLSYLRSFLKIWVLVSKYSMQLLF